MKKLLLATAVVVLTQGYAFAEYQTEITGQYTKVDIHDTDYTIGGKRVVDSQNYGANVTVNAEKVNTLGLPIAEAAYLRGISQAKFGYNRLEQLDLDLVTLDGIFQLNNFYAMTGLDYVTQTGSKTPVRLNDGMNNGYVRLGAKPVNGMSIDLAYRFYIGDIGSKDNRDGDFGVNFKYVKPLLNGMAYNIEASGKRALSDGVDLRDVMGVTKGTDIYRMAFDFYPAPTLSLGAFGDYIDGKRGMRDTNGWGLRGRLFLNENISVGVEGKHADKNTPDYDNLKGTLSLLF